METIESYEKHANLMIMAAKQEDDNRAFLNSVVQLLKSAEELALDVQSTAYPVDCDQVNIADVRFS